MFLRFVTTEVHRESHKEAGLFRAAYRLRDDDMLSAEEEVALKQIYSWFNKNLKEPTRFTTAKPPYDGKRKNGISWFKDSANEHIDKMREIVDLLERHDVPVRMIKAARPGYIVYEDEFQIVAVPFADSEL
jgi:hypothetical protein